MPFSIELQQAYLCPMHANDDLQARWWRLEEQLIARFGKKPDMEAILFLIGLQETGAAQASYSKEQKQDLMHVAVCTLLTPSGYFAPEGLDDDGWPHFRQLREMPNLPLKEQEDFLRDHVLLYFQQHALTD